MVNVIISDTIQKIKSFSEGDRGKAVYMILIIILVAGSSFGLGRLSQFGGNSGPIKIIYPEGGFPASAASSASNPAYKAPTRAGNSSQGSFVASKKGKKYYPVNCPAAGSLKEDNKVFFNTEAEAQAAGYSKSSSC
jgi:hypothetical protein